MSRSPRHPSAEPEASPGPAALGLPLVVLATLAVLVTAADTYVVVLALPDILTGVGVGLDELQRPPRSSADSCSATPPPCRCWAGWPTCAAACRCWWAAPAVRAGLAVDGDRRLLGPAVAGRGLQGIGAVGWSLRRSRWSPTAGRRSAVAAAGRGRGGAGGRCRAGPAGRRGCARGGRLAGHLLAQPAPRTGPGRRRGRRDVRPDVVGLASRPWRPSPLLQLAAPAALAEDVTLGLLYLPLVPSLEATTLLVVVAVLAAAGLVVRSLTRPEAGCPSGDPAGCRRRSTCWARPWRSWRSAAWCGPSRQPIRRPSSWRTARGCCPSHWSPGWPSSCTSAGRPIRCCPCARSVRSGRGARCSSTCWWVRHRWPRWSTSPCSPGPRRRRATNLGAAFVLLRPLPPCRSRPVAGSAGGWRRGSSRPAGWPWPRWPSWP